MTKLNIAVDEDTFVLLMVKELRAQLDIVRSNIVPIRKNMKKYQVKDIEDARETYIHLKYIIEYYGG